MLMNLNLRQPMCLVILFAFLLNIWGPLPVHADDFVLPKPGVMVHLSPPMNPPILKGIKVYTNNPFKCN